jgi:hypothetical protein
VACRPTRSRTCSSESGSGATRRATSTRWASCRRLPRRHRRRASRLSPLRPRRRRLLLLRRPHLRRRRCGS